MQHIRRFSIVVFTILLLCALSSSALAHSGKTDSNGGHYNKSTGEYHYHHGYSAHDHWDMDDDGDIDCPYKFDDQTNHNYNNNNDTDTRNSTQTKPDDNSIQQENVTDKKYAYIAIGFVAVFFIVVNCIAIHIDITDKSPQSKPISIPSAFISFISTITVFVLLFYIVCLCKRPIQLRPASLIDMVGILFLSAFPGGLVMIFTTWVSGFFNMILCSLFKVEAYCGLEGPFKRLIVPLSYAFAVFFFLLQ